MHSSTDFLRVQQFIEGQVLPARFWPHVHLSAEVWLILQFLVVTCGQHAEYPRSSLPSRIKLKAPKSNYQNVLQCRFGTDPVDWP